MKAAWVLVLAIVMVSCGDADSSSQPTEAAAGMDSFAFQLTVESTDGGEQHVETTEGVFDPSTRNASAVHVAASTEQRMIMVDGVMYFETPDLEAIGTEEFAAPPPGSCYSAPWQSMAPAPAASGVLVDINNPTGLDIERLQEMVATQSDEVTLLPGDQPDGGGSAYSVELADGDQDDDRHLEAMVVRVDDAGRVVAVDWSVRVAMRDIEERSNIDDPGDNGRTESMSLTLSDFGTAVDVEAPTPDDTCDLEEAGVEQICGFGAADINEAATGAIYTGDRDALREIVESFTADTNGSCPESLSVPFLVGSAACDPDMVRFLFEDLQLDPNQGDVIDPGGTALFSITYDDPEDDPEFSEVCTPEQDLETVRVLLEAGADPCIGPEAEHGYDPALNKPEWDPPAIGISEWDEAPEIVAIVEAAATTCTP